ncbi:MULTISPECIES: DUF1684 domain-containing protein [unclassified Imperialibacter]|uniref:DUF1684 domain-containing protein n=1 Tax=unclassified Imperialibacter TaxID=2629706 RepID=UPI001256EDC5|nr:MULTISPECIES: DUF1684 domain-containing protein [unclassified Imperialibacter]CAD5247663.1 conserved hypothetical protein [Imperialibacter sp. 75]CAD5247781.1 conserved hypothetical protein [Imperialibacter sp. 89]VVS97070.1 conserved hypothetical protein [Imperialibacter sp. EC-SDR9]
MKGPKLIISILAVVVGVVIFLANSGDESPEEYIASIEKERQEKNEFMRSSSDSPFKGKEFTELKYFPADPAYKVMANVNQLEARELVTLGTSDGKTQQYQKFAFVEFEIKGQRKKLTLLRQAGPGMQNVTFLAFADATSGESTYGGGRYLDVSVKNARQILLDFNLAYNPYCEYNSSYSCPLPLKENVLDIAIEAGEKNY